MTLKINSIEVQLTKETKDNEPLYMANVHVASSAGPLDAIFLFTRSGIFLLKHGRPLVKFHNYDSSCEHKYGIGQTSYQALLYNRIIEKLGSIKTQVASYLMRHDFIDPQSLKRRDTKLYTAAIQLETLSFK